MDLLYVQVTGYPAWLIGYDWQGRPRATVHLKEAEGPDGRPAGVAVAPNGSGFTAGASTFDRKGKVIYQGPIPDKSTPWFIWSDDGSLLCGVKGVSTITDGPSAQGSTDYYLMRRTPTSSPVTVARFLHIDGIPGDLGFGLRACAPQLDRALAVKTVCCGTAGATTLRLSDGAVINTWARDDGDPVFSPDGQLIADPTWDPATRSPTATVVKTLLGGVVIARYGLGVTFRAISRDNRYAVVLVGPPGDQVAEVIEVSTARVVWHDQTSRTINAIWARPNSGDVAIAFTASPPRVPCGGSDCTNPEGNIVIVHPDGSANALAGNFLTSLWPWSF